MTSVRTGASQVVTPFPGEPVGWMMEQAGAEFFHVLDRLPASRRRPRPEGEVRGRRCRACQRKTSSASTTRTWPSCSGLRSSRRQSAGEEAHVVARVDYGAREGGRRQPHEVALAGVRAKGHPHQLRLAGAGEHRPVARGKGSQRPSGDVPWHRCRHRSPADRRRDGRNSSGRFTTPKRSRAGSALGIGADGRMSPERELRDRRRPDQDHVTSRLTGAGPVAACQDCASATPRRGHSRGRSSRPPPSPRHLPTLSTSTESD